MFDKIQMALKNKKDEWQKKRLERAAEEAGLFSGAAAQAVSIIAVITLAKNENNFLFMAFHSLRK